MLRSPVVFLTTTAKRPSVGPQTAEPQWYRCTWSFTMGHCGRKNKKGKVRNTASWCFLSAALHIVLGTAMYWWCLSLIHAKQAVRSPCTLPWGAMQHTAVGQLYADWDFMASEQFPPAAAAAPSTLRLFNFPVGQKWWLQRRNEVWGR